MAEAVTGVALLGASIATEGGSPPVLATRRWTGDTGAVSSAAPVICWRFPLESWPHSAFASLSVEWQPFPGDPARNSSSSYSARYSATRVASPVPVTPALVGYLPAGLREQYR